MTSLISRPARVGLITDQTGALSFMGVANVNLAKMVTDDINAHGGLLGRPVELYVEDSATDDEVAHTAAARLVREADVDVVIGGIYSSTRQAIKRPVVDEAAKLYIYPEQYEGQRPHHPAARARPGRDRPARAPQCRVAAAAPRSHQRQGTAARARVLAPELAGERPHPDDHPGLPDSRLGPPRHPPAAGWAPDLRRRPL